MSSQDPRTVVITGASTGIGRATALRLDRAGWQVFAGVRKDADAESIAAEATGRLTPVKIDVADQATIDAVAKQIGDITNNRLDALVNNAGITVQGPLEHLPLDDMRRQFEVNVTGQVSVTQAFLPMLRPTKGRVVFVGSVAGRSPGLPFVGPYTASKMALESIADALRIELRPAGIHVVIIEPGSIATPLWDKGADTVEDIIESIPAEHHRYYVTAMRNAAKLSDKIGRTGISPDVVAKKIERALTSSRPRTRYLVGKDAIARVYLENAIPDKMRDRAAVKMLFKK